MIKLFKKAIVKFEGFMLLAAVTTSCYGLSKQNIILFNSEGKYIIFAVDIFFIFVVKDFGSKY